jgi:hypothetical protein
MLMIKPDTKPRAGAETRPLQMTLPAASPAALRHAQTLAMLMSQAAARFAGNSAASVALVPLALRADTWTELFAMQDAVWQRSRELQQDWLQGWAGWLQEYADLNRANTLSEHLEQQFNLVAQVGSLLKDQIADVLNLQENIQVGYGFWMAQKATTPAEP